MWIKVALCTIDIEYAQKLNFIFDKDVGIELLNSFNDEEMEHIINILYEIRKLS